ncbi:MAG TPA: hypothetical protein VNS08_05620 [Ureibacillus sp.]|nr:hypothetical protein [Ureibacillus sp.]
MIKAIDKVEIEEYMFLLEYDTSAEAIGRDPYVLWIFKNGEPLLLDDEKTQVRKYFPPVFQRSYLVEFCHNFVSNERFRKLFIWSA